MDVVTVLIAYWWIKDLWKGVQVQVDYCNSKCLYIMPAWVTEAL